MAHHVVIIGAGPRGTYAFRRLALQLSRSSLKKPVVVHVIDRSGNFGGGCVHDPAQPEYLLLNTVAAQITAIGDDDEAGRAIPAIRTLHGFLAEKGLPFGENDYPGRCHHGQYLSAVFEWTAANLSDGVSLRRHPVSALDIDCARGQRVILDNGEWINADEILLATGHSRLRIHSGSKEEQWVQFAEDCRQQGKNISYVHDVYPIPEKTQHIKGGEAVYVIGMGLTAVDIVRAFTIGRGGRFEGTTYRKTGQEPVMILGSRLGIPYCARAFNQKTKQYKPSIFTYEVVEKLKADHKKLDFQKHLFPLFWMEMESAYYSMIAGSHFRDEYACCQTELERKALIERCIPAEKRIHWESFENPMAELQRKRQGHVLFDSFESYMGFVLSLIREDLSEAEKGNMTSPLKSAIDSVFRDCRDVLRNAVNFGGLTARSHQYLVSVFDRVNNRIAVGPPIESTRQLLMLAESGYVLLSGPSPKLSIDKGQSCFVVESDQVVGSRRRVHHVLNGRIHGVHIKSDTSVLMQNLLNKGIIRAYVNQDDDFRYETGGLDLTEDFHVIGKDGSFHPHICAAGIPTEGKLWFNAADARPDVNSTAITQVSTWAKGVVERLGGAAR